MIVFDYCQFIFETTVKLFAIVSPWEQRVEPSQNHSQICLLLNHKYENTACLIYKCIIAPFEMQNFCE